MRAKRNEANAQVETIEMNPEDQNDDVMSTEEEIEILRSRGLMARVRRKEL
jgi:hypothetical protein